MTLDRAADTEDLRARIAARIQQLTPLAQLRLNMTPVEVDDACTYRAVVEELTTLLRPESVGPPDHHGRAVRTAPYNPARTTASQRVDHR